MSAIIAFFEFAITFLVDASNFAWIAYSVAAGVALLLTIWLSHARRSWAPLKVVGRLLTIAMAVSLPALIVIRGDVNRFHQRIDDLAQFNLVRAANRAAPAPDATGRYWFYSFYRDPAQPQNLIFCKERVIIEPSATPDFDFTYYTVPAESTCGAPVAQWNGALIWLEEHRAFLDVARDPQGTDFLIAYLKLPWQPARSIREFDSVGFQMGPADYGTNPIANVYMLSARDLSEGEVLERLSRDIRTRVAVAGTGSAPLSVSCHTRTPTYGAITVEEIMRCDQRALYSVYAELSGPRED